MQCTLNGIVEHDVLFGQFQQHGVVKELVDGDVLTQALQGEGEGLPSDRECGITRSTRCPMYSEGLLQAGRHQQVGHMRGACMSYQYATSHTLRSTAG